MRPPGFHRRGLWIVIALAGLSFLFLLALSVLGDEALGVRSVQADSYSYSALGHRALLELLDRRDTPTVISRFDSGRRAGDEALLVLAEPRIPKHQSRRHGWLERSLEESEDVLLVLPKRQAQARSTESSRWVESTGLIHTDEVERLLEQLGGDVELVRTPDATGWDPGRYSHDPLLSDYQLLRGGISPSIQCDQGILLGTYPHVDGSVMILTDPDLLANHGIGLGQNADLVLEILDQLRDGRAIVFDEELHGFRSEPSVWRALFLFPLNLVTMSVFLAACVLTFAGLRRFGPPRPVDRETTVGKELLIRNTAELLGMGDRAPHVVREYFQQTLADLRRILHAPNTRNTEELCEWLKRRAERRRSTHDVPDLYRQVQEQLKAGHRRLTPGLDLARRIHRMKQDLLHGS